MTEKVGGGFGGGGRVEVIKGKGCSRLFLEFSSSLRGIQSSSLEPLSPASTVSLTSEFPVKSHGPFSDLVICVTGLSKETRKQVKEATERLGGQYSPHLHARCTHLVVQSFRGHKFEHALKHGPTNGLFLVSISWFVDSVKRNVRLDESLYRMGVQNDGLTRLDQNSVAENGCLPAGLLGHSLQFDKVEGPLLRFPERETKKLTVIPFYSGQFFYMDVDVPDKLRHKVAEALSIEGATILSQWFVGCNASHAVCEGPSVRKYLGHLHYLVTPQWVLKSAKEKCQQRLVHLSPDLARYTGAMLDTFQDNVLKEEFKRVTSPNVPFPMIKPSFPERQTTVNLAKDGVRKRRNHKMQTCQEPILPITPSRLLDSISWSISEPTSTASIYTDSSSLDNSIDDQESNFFDAKEDRKESQTSFVSLSRMLRESEKSELVFNRHFLTVMFPVDRFSEMGPRSRTFFSNSGFTCLQILDHIHSFYQEPMSDEEIELAIHTDSRHADRLRSAYSGSLEFKRIDFLGSRKCFEMLRHVSGDNCSNVYELLISA